MKTIISVTVCLVVATLIVGNDALPAKKRVAYVQPAAQWISAPQSLMYMRYVRPVHTHARSTQAAALVAGDNVATGTYLEDSEGTPAFGPIAADNAEGQAEQGLEVDVAEAAIPVAYPSEGDFVEPEPAQDPISPAVDIAAETPVLPAKRFLPVDNKKVYVELEQPSDNEVAAEEQDDAAAVIPQDAVNDEDDDMPVVPTVAKNPARVPNAHRPAIKKPTKEAKPLPSGTFFPVDFGGVSGGAIAIAHSLSTDAGGSATSNAVAYGTPPAESARYRARRH